MMMTRLEELKAAYFSAVSAAYADCWEVRDADAAADAAWDAYEAALETYKEELEKKQEENDDD